MGYMLVDGNKLDGNLTAIADAIRGKTGKTDALTLDQMPGEIAGIVTGGGGSGIPGVKFIDVDITVEASTATAVNYVVEDLELLSSAENPTKDTAFISGDTYIAFVAPKEITGTAVGTNLYLRTLGIMNGHTNYASAVASILYSGNGSGANLNSGIYGVKLSCTKVENGKIFGKLTASVKHNSAGAYEVVAGVYNVQVWYLTDWKRGDLL